MSTREELSIFENPLLSNFGQGRQEEEAKNNYTISESLQCYMRSCWLPYNRQVARIFSFFAIKAEPSLDFPATYCEVNTHAAKNNEDIESPNFDNFV